MDEKQNIDKSNGFSNKIGRTHFLVNFSFKKDADYKAMVNYDMPQFAG